jgi:hypothetical protein
MRIDGLARGPLPDDAVEADQIVVARPDFEKDGIREDIVDDVGAREGISYYLHLIELVGIACMALGLLQGKREFIRKCRACCGDHRCLLSVQ